MAEQQAPPEQPDEPRLTTTDLNVGGARLRVQALLPPDTQIKIGVEVTGPEGWAQEQVLLGRRPARGLHLRSAWDALRALGWEGALMGLALLLYLVTRLFHIADYPIFFFTDEAVQTVLAADLVRDGFYSYDDELLPTYFYNGYQYNLGTSVYLQVLPYMLFGKSVALTRGLAAATTLLAAVSVGLALRQVFKLPYAWAGVLLLSITPAWFLHSRTAFETGLAVTFFAVFLYCYLMYRQHDPRWLYPAVAAGALTFYSYSPARVVVVFTAVLFFLSDLRYHLRHWKIVLTGLGMALLAALPYLRFSLLHPTSSLDHLRVLNSYWTQPLSTVEKLGRYLGEFLQGLNPAYWYLPNKVDLERHVMNHHGHVFWFTFPFLLAGLVLSLRRVRQPEYRVLLLALLAAPAGAALVAVGITRILIMVVPLALLSGIGLAWLLDWVRKKLCLRGITLPLLVFGLLAFTNVYMTRDALVNGVYWDNDYGLGGMQWGARQLFGEIKTVQAAHPDTRLVVSPSWANGTDTVARFFFDDPLPFDMASIEGYFYEYKPIDPNVLFVMIPREYELMLESGKFTGVQVEQMLNHPDGTPGFYFVRLRYVDDIHQILDAEREARRQLQQASLDVHGETWQVGYSYLDMGTVDQVFDGDDDTLIRTMEANPLVLEVAYPTARPVGQVEVRVGGTPTEITLVLTGMDGAQITTRVVVEESPTPRSVLLEPDEVVDCTHLHLEVFSPRDQEPAHVHLWEVRTAPSPAEGMDDGS